MEIFKVIDVCVCACVRLCRMGVLLELYQCIFLYAVCVYCVC